MGVLHWLFWQDPVVQGLPSSQSASMTQQLATTPHTLPTQEVQTLLPGQSVGVWQKKQPAMAGWTQPWTGSQRSFVQGLPSSQLGGVPGVQTPA